jgi:hypothetical protein
LPTTVKTRLNNESLMDTPIGLMGLNLFLSITSSSWG